jgi:hypothetical protein
MHNRRVLLRTLEVSLRRMVVALIILPVAIGAGTLKSAAEESCMIGDAALCLAAPNCHWDGEKRGCYPGPGEFKDACAAHGDKTICDSDVALGCKWTAETNKCESRAN